MKKIILSLSVLLAVAAAPVYAAPAVPGIEVSEKIQRSFDQEFKGAEMLSWSETGDLYKATFLYDGLCTLAYFSPDGNLEGTVRALFYNQLPLAVITSLEKKFGEPAVYSILEITNPEGTKYVVDLQSKAKKQKYHVTVNSTGYIAEITRKKSK